MSTIARDELRVEARREWTKEERDERVRRGIWQAALGARNWSRSDPRELLAYRRMLRHLGWYMRR